MKLTEEVKSSIDKSVLCWLASVSPENIPNVSPKEIFTYYNTDTIIIANIASPQSAKNIMQNPQVCVSFIDILIQKGFQVKGRAKLVRRKEPGFAPMEKILLNMTEGKFPFSSLFEIEVMTIKPIIAPRYSLYPDTTEADQIERAKKSYGF